MFASVRRGAYAVKEGDVCYCTCVTGAVSQQFLSIDLCLWTSIFECIIFRVPLLFSSPFLVSLLVSVHVHGFIIFHF